MSMKVEIESLLNLPGVRVTRIEIEAQEIVLHVELTATKTRCHRCGQWATEFYHTGETLRLRHWPLFRVYSFSGLKCRGH